MFNNETLFAFLLDLAVQAAQAYKKAYELVLHRFYSYDRGDDPQDEIDTDQAMKLSAGADANLSTIAELVKTFTEDERKNIEGEINND